MRIPGLITLSMHEQVIEYTALEAMYLDDLRVYWEWDSLEERTILVPAQQVILPWYVVAIATLDTFFRVLLFRLGITRFDDYTRKVRGVNSGTRYTK